MIRNCAVYIIEYEIDGKIQKDGEWWTIKANAVSQAKANYKDMGWRWRVLKVWLPVKTVKSEPMRPIQKKVKKDNERNRSKKHL